MALNPPSLKLSPVQQLAAQRIQFFQQQLEKRGYHVRLSFEQEFVVASSGIPAADALRPDNPNSIRAAALNKYRDYSAAAHFASARHPTFTMIEREQSSAEVPLQVYEAKFDGLNQHRLHTPLEVAYDTLRFREKTLPELLKHGSALSSTWASKPLSPILQAVPYPNIPRWQEATIGLHGNLGVYNEKGENLFATKDIKETTPFMLACAEHLKQLQARTGLALMATEQSMRRYDANINAPRNISVGTGKNIGHSILLRHGVRTLHGQQYPTPDNRYIEDRFMGADSDPLVAATIELAAVYAAVITHERTGHWTTPTKEALDLPAKPERWQERLAHSRSAKELLGEPLHAAILAQSGYSL